MDTEYCAVCGCELDSDIALECECRNVVCSGCWGGGACVECEGKLESNKIEDDDDNEKQPCLN